ncbi:MAG: hypothetical protein ACMG6S_20810, partial [Byssovorax sp.]
MGWTLPGQNAVFQRLAPANDQSDLRGQLDELDEQIGAQHDRIAALMHERNARPEDKDVAARLQGAFEALRVMQHAQVDRMSTYLRPSMPLPSKEDSEVVKQALKIPEAYENTPSDDSATRDPLHSKP